MNIPKMFLIAALMVTGSLCADYAKVHVRNGSNTPLDFDLYTTSNRKQSFQNIAPKNSIELELATNECIKDIWFRPTGSNSNWNGMQGDAAGCVGDIWYYIDVNLSLFSGH